LLRSLDAERHKRISQTAVDLEHLSDRPAESGTVAVQAIGRALEAHYADLVHAPLPDKFLQLLARLEDDKSALKAEGKRDALD
jgi:hypothetical protein